jgi:hypothetical protein
MHPRPSLRSRVRTGMADPFPPRLRYPRPTFPDAFGYARNDRASSTHAAHIITFNTRHAMLPSPQRRVLQHRTSITLLTGVAQTQCSARRCSGRSTLHAVPRPCQASSEHRRPSLPPSDRGTRPASQRHVRDFLSSPGIPVVSPRHALYIPGYPTPRYACVFPVFPHVQWCGIVENGHERDDGEPVTLFRFRVGEGVVAR